MNGLIITPLNWRMTSNEIDFCISNSEAKCVIYQQESLVAVKNTTKSNKLINRIVGDKY